MDFHGAKCQVAFDPHSQPCARGITECIPGDIPRVIKLSHHTSHGGEPDRDLEQAQECCPGPHATYHHNGLQCADGYIGKTQAEDNESPQERLQRQTVDQIIDGCNDALCIECDETCKSDRSSNAQPEWISFPGCWFKFQRGKSA